MTPDIFMEFGPLTTLYLKESTTIIRELWCIVRSWNEKGEAAFNGAITKPCGVSDLQRV